MLRRLLLSTKNKHIQHEKHFFLPEGQKSLGRRPKTSAGVRSKPAYRAVPSSICLSERCASPGARPPNLLTLRATTAGGLRALGGKYSCARNKKFSDYLPNLFTLLKDGMIKGSL